MTAASAFNPGRGGRAFTGSKHRPRHPRTAQETAMSLAARLPAPVAAIDAKRIAATSLAIAVHAAVLMMLLMPMQVAEPPKAEEPPMVVEFERITPRPTPPPPQPVRRPQVREVVQTPPRTPPVQVEVLNTDPSPIDPYVPEVTLEETPVGELVVDTGPSFVQLSADVAPPPPYPAQALRMRQEGRVTLRVLVDEAGRPAQVEVESSSGFRALDEAALKVVKKRWHFVAATRDGAPIQAWALVPVVFEIK
jgi:protein TonB